MRGKAWLRVVGVIAVLALTAASCGGDDNEGSSNGSDQGDEAKEGGTIVIAAEQELTNFNQNTAADNLLWGGMIVRLIWPQAYFQKPDITFTKGAILAGDAKVVSEDPFTLEWTIVDDAVWSDGTPVSSDDLEYYWQSCNGAIDPGEPTTTDEASGEKVTAMDCVSTDGYDKITEFTKVDGKTARAVFSQPIAEYEQLFSNPMPPAHIAKTKGEDAWAKAFVSSPIVSAGPYQLKEYKKGESLTLERNPEYWGPKAHLDTITFRFFTDSGQIPQALQNGEVDLMYPQPQLDMLDQVAAMEGVTSETSLGTQWEHLTYNFRNADLAKPEVREAIAYGVDRQEIVDTLLKPFDERVEVINNRVFVNNQTGYEDNGGPYNTPDVDKAKELLTAAGYTLGSDGYFERPDGSRLSLRIGTTGGNKLREDTEELLIDQFKKFGVELKLANQPGSDIFTPIFGGEATAGDWDIALFAWVATATPAISTAPVYGTGQGNNAGAYTNPKVDDLMDQAIGALDDQERIDLLNQADQLMWAGTDMPDLPLYQKPSYIAYTDKYTSIEDNTTSEGFTWNAQDWAVTG